MMLKGSEPDEEALRSWLAHNGVQVLTLPYESEWYFLDASNRTRRFPRTYLCMTLLFISFHASVG